MNNWRESLFPSLIFLTILSPIFLLLPLIPLSNSQEKVYRVKRVVDEDTLPLTNGERVGLICAVTPEVHESKKLYREAQTTRSDIKTIKALGKNGFSIHQVTGGQKKGIITKHELMEKCKNLLDKFPRPARVEMSRKPDHS